MIPLCDLSLCYQQLKPEIDAAMQEVAAGTRYILGPNVKALEQEVADYLGVTHAIGVNSGTDALHLALRALEIGPGDEVITTPFTFIATTEAIGLVGARPVFVDIEPGTLNIDPQRIEAAIPSRTKAIIPVHLYGRPCNMTAIMEIARRHDLRVVEDCAQSLGASCDGQRLGTIGDVGCLSFFPSKNLGCLGDGGMVVTGDAKIYERVEMLRRHGGRVKYHHEELGLNSRLDELQAAVLRVKLPHLDRWNAARQQAAARYEDLLGPLCETPPADAEYAQPSVWHQYTIQVDRRDEVLAHLKSAGVGSAIYYPVPLHLQQVHAKLNHRRGDFPVSEQAADRCLSLPMFPELSAAQQRQVADTLRQAVEHHPAAAA